MTKLFTYSAIFLLLSCPLLANTATAENTVRDEDTRELGYREALILGVVEGITEYLPISSTGHLILTNHLLGLTEQDEKPANMVEGQPESDAEEAYTLADAVNAYTIIIQGGAILAVLLLYWKRLWSILMGILGRDPQGLKLGLLILTAFLPAAIIGPFLDAPIESHLFGPGPVAFALAAGSLLMFWTDRRNRKMKTTHRLSDPPIESLSFRQALFIGLLQCVAMWPGTSRSMMTLVGGMLMGLSPRRAAEFSFLLGLLTLSAASAYKIVLEGPKLLTMVDTGPVVFGIFVSFVSALLAVRWLISYLTRHGLSLFAIYRLLLAGLIVIFLL